MHPHLTHHPSTSTKPLAGSSPRQHSDQPTGGIEVRFVSRQQARRYPCPKCGAVVGAMCFRYNGKPRLRCHQERHDVAVQDALRHGGWGIVRSVGVGLFPHHPFSNP